MMGNSPRWEGNAMRAILIACCLLFGNPWCRGDDTSGPNRSTIWKCSWGTIYFEPGTTSNMNLETTNDGFKFKSDQGEVSIKGSEVNGYRLTGGNEVLIINANDGDLEIKGQDKSWTLRSQNQRWTLKSSHPRDTVIFERGDGSFTVKGEKGFVTVSRDAGTLHVKSPRGTAKVTSEYGNRIISGFPISQVPYLGRGLYIPFHGAGIFIDVARKFPMQEVAEWVDWKPILEP